MEVIRAVAEGFEARAGALHNVGQRIAIRLGYLLAMFVAQFVLRECLRLERRKSIGRKAPPLSGIKWLLVKLCCASTEVKEKAEDDELPRSVFKQICCLL